MTGFTEWQREMDDHMRQLESQIASLIGQNRELIERQTQLQAQHEAERQRWHQHMVTMQPHLYRLIQEKRDWELEQAAYIKLERFTPETQFAPKPAWMQALSLYQPSRN